jgi:hypothetical protein
MDTPPPALSIQDGKLRPAPVETGSWEESKPAQTGWGGEVRNLLKQPGSGDAEQPRLRLFAMPGTAMVKLVLYTGWEWEEVSRLRRLQDFDEQEGEDHEVLISQGYIEEEQISYW